MPWYQLAMKDVISCEKLRGAAYSVDPEMSEWGNPARVMFGHPKGSERGELKHLSTRRKRNQRDSVSSGERKRNSLNQ